MAATTPRLGIDHVTVVPDDPEGDAAGADRADGSATADGVEGADAA